MMNILKVFFIGAGVFMLGAFNANATIVDVFAKANSTTGGTGAVTGINIASGDHLVMNTDVNDCWSAGFSPRTSNADGLVGTTGSCQPTAGFPLYTQAGVSAPYGSLMGKIGASNFFFVGTSYDQIITTMTGALTLFYWDENSGDNSGSVAVNISLNPNQGQTVPEPAPLALLGLGLMGLGLARRRKSA